MSVTVHTRPQESPVSTLKDVNEFFVPTILNFNLKKTENRLPVAKPESAGSHENGDIITEEDEDVIEMSPIKKGSNHKYNRQTSSFLLEPFLKPVATEIESNKENPVLKALYGGKSPQGLAPWSYVTKTSINNCHPFKKTEFSHDLSTDDTPVQVPKSLQKKASKIRRTIVKELTPEPPPPVLKEVQLNSVVPYLSSSSGTSCDTTHTNNISNISNISHASNSSNASNASNVSNISDVSNVSNDTSVNKPTTAPVPEKPNVSMSNFNKKEKVLSQSTIVPSKQRVQYINNERLIQLRSMVDNAIKNHKIYSMTGCYNSVRNALKQRGWIEKIDSEVKGRRKNNKYEEIGLYDAAFQFVQKYQTVAAMRLSMQTVCGYTHNDQIRYTGQGEAEIMNRMLKNVTEDLCWLSRPYPYYCWKDFDKFEMVNRLPKAYFSNKVGLCNSLQQIQWFYESGVCSTQFPRTYNMSMKDEVEAFKEDFRLTACINTLKWFLQTYKLGGETAVRSVEGKVDMNVIEFALRRCAEFVKTKQHEDIDILDTPNVWEYQWEQFITQYYRLVNEGQVLKDNKEGVSTKAILSNVQSMLNILKPFWPQFDIDGYRNFWIVKPGGRCCGAGIVIKNNLDQILVLINPNSMKETRFVVQKYIERPLLIYNTKFDIRQWFLVTNVYPLTIWMYKESYLRFCSQPFTLKNTHESIHLCNNAVQRKYKNGKRDRSLPEENMWDCYTFQTYLKAMGYPDVWEKHIYPGMKEGFIGALLASQETMERKKNCFELYGADFMISESLTDGPWLIEINSNPAMDSSTSVTARMCPQVLEDIIKVVIDRRDNKSAPTGAFEMVFRQNCPPIPPYLGMSLCIKGKKALKSPVDFRGMSRKSKSKNCSEHSLYTDTEEESTGEEIVSVDDPSKDPEILKSETSSSEEGNPEDLLPKTPSKTEKLNPGTQNKDTGSKRRKIDWVRKNIEDLKIFHAIKHGKQQAGSVSCGSSPRKEPPNLEDLFKEQVIKMLETMEIKEVLKQVLKMKKEFKKESLTQKSEDSLNGGIEILRQKSNGSFDDISNKCNITQDVRKALVKALHICRRKAEGEDIEWETVLDEVSDACRRAKSTKSCPNFDSKFELELLKLEEKDETKSSSKSTESLNSFFSASSLVGKTSSKTSLEYFRDWRSKLTETRETCEDMLTKLQVFNEENSKVKFQNALRKRLKDEVEFVNKIRQLRKCRKLGKGRSVRRERHREGSDKAKMEVWKHWGCDGDGGLTPLAINSETGAVRAINSLPKIKQRSRPLLPNGSSGHGRKIDVALEQPTYYH